MSPYESIQACVTGAGVPCCHMAWPLGSAPGLPWAVFFLVEMSSFCADGRLYTQVGRWCVELYQESRDAAVEAAVEDAIERDFGPFSKEEAWVEEEKCLQTTYEFTVLNNGDAPERSL